MKKFNNNPIVTAAAVFFVLVAPGFIRPVAALAATAPTLGDAASFAVLGATTVTNTGSSVLNGDLGLYAGTSITGFFGTTANEGPGVVSPGYFVHQTDATAHLAQTAASAAYTTLSSQPCPNDLSGQNLGGLTLTPGVYCFSAAAGLTGVLTLNAQGDPNAVWIFRIGTALTTASGSSVVFSNGGSGPGCNVFWQVGSAATLGTSSTFVGTIIANTEAVTLTTGATLRGRAISRIAAVTLDTNTITVSTCTAAPSLTLNKILVKDNGGTAAESDWMLTATGLTTLSGAGASGSTDVVSNGSFAAGTYTLSESAGPTGYTASSWSCVKNSAAPVTGASITLVAGDVATCTITNDDDVPVPVPGSAAPSSGGGSTGVGTINVVKLVVNDNGGTKTVADFPLFVNGTAVISGATNNFPAFSNTYAVTETADSHYIQTFSGDCDSTGHVTLINPGQDRFCIITNNDIGAPLTPPVPPLIDVVKVPNPLALPAGPGLVTYAYTVRNIGTVAMTDVTMVGDTCSPISLVSGDTNADAKLDINETWIYSCATTLAETHTNTVVATGWANGISATDIASATVVVGIPIVPPLIHVTKLPSRLTLPAQGGLVTYTEKVTNPGAVALTNVLLNDDTCDPMHYISGDTNGDSKLDPTETWTYTCQTNVTKTTTNTATVRGEANGLTVRDFAIATVVVAAPGFPKAGLPPEEKSIGWNIIILAGTLMVLLISVTVVLKKYMI